MTLMQNVTTATAVDEPIPTILENPTPPTTPNPWLSGDVLWSIVSTVILALSPLWCGFIASQFASAYAIPSRSMEATLRVGDVVLAEKISSLLKLPLEREDLVLFAPPDELEEITRQQGDGQSIGYRDLFIKRVAAVAGDEVELDERGRIKVNGVERKPPPLVGAGCSEPEALPPSPPPPPQAASSSSSSSSGPTTALSAAEAALQRATDPAVASKVRSLLESGSISESEAVALLREVLPPARESASLTADAVSQRTAARIFGNVEQKAVDPEQVGVKIVVPPESVFVLGDCEARSTDSRVWGPLALSRVAARPVLRVWPPERYGEIDGFDEARNPFRRSLLQFRGALDDAAVGRAAEGDRGPR